MAAELRTRSLVVLGLSSLAVAQPLLDLFGRNPEFFVAGNYSTGQIVWFALLITLLPPLVGIAAITVATLIDRRAGTIVYAIVVAVLGAAFVLAVLRTIGVDPVVLVVVVALARRRRPPWCWRCGRTAGGCCCRISPSPTSPSSPCSCSSARRPKLIAGGGSGDLGDVTDSRAVSGPVVVLVLDEFPAATIMRPDGTINSDRYPGFRRAGVGEHVVPQRVEPAQPHPSGGAVDPRRPPRPRRHAADVHGPPAQPVHAARRRGPGAQLRVGDVVVPARHLRRGRPPSR